MNETHSERHPLDALAEEFVARYRKGERPSLTEYARRYPELADEIRDLFPALVMMEDVRPGTASGAVAREAAAGGRQPERVGDYRILREVGRGGMGVVYEAEQESLGRHVALKVLPARALLDPRQVQRFRREARAAARLHHSNIVPVFEVGRDGDCFYYAMQLIRGQGLDEVIKELRRLRAAGDGGLGREPPAAGPVARSLLTGRFRVPQAATPSPAPADGLAVTAADTGAPAHQPGRTTHRATEPPSSARLPGQADLSSSGPDPRTYYRSVARLGVQAAEALAHAHERGIIHRDVKPSNLLLDAAGVVWVTDFGLARTDEEGLTHTGDLVGTIRYMAPERFRGQGDARADVYGLGLTLYELLTLRPAFDDPDRLRLVERIGQQEPPRPRALDPRVPRDLETVVLKAIAKEPARRYPSALDLAIDLRRFLEDRSVRARRALPWEYAWRWCRRNPLAAGLLVLVTGLVLAVAGISLASAVGLRRALGETRAAERLARLREAEALVGQAHGTRLSRQPGQRFEALAALGKAAGLGRELGQPPAWFDRLRNEAIAALALQDVCVTQECPDAFPPGTVGVDVSDDFEWYARTTEQGGCTIYRVADGTEVARLPEELGEPAVAEFGAGRALAVRGMNSGRFRLWDLGGAGPARRSEESGVASWYFRADGRHLALAHGDGSLDVYDVTTGTRLARLAPGGITRMTCALPHPAEPLLAVSSYLSARVEVRDWRSGAVVASASVPWRGNGVPDWSPDGRTLVVPDGDRGRAQQYAFDPAAPALRPTRLLEGPGSGDITYSPAGDCFVVRGWSGRVQLVDAVSGQLLFTTPPLPHTARPRLRFDRTGRRLAGARVGERNDRLGLWSVADAREYQYLVHAGNGVNHNLPSRGPAVHPASRLAAVGLTDGVALFDLDTGREVAHLPSGSRVGPAVTFDGTGCLLTSGFDGCFRWPVRPDAADPGRLLIGPPERLPFHPGDIEIAASRDGRVVAQCMWSGYGMAAFAGGWILHPNAPLPRRVGPALSHGCCSVSPDGRWAAFAGPDLRLAVYDAATGERRWQAPAVGAYTCCFTPDGRWLLTTLDGGRPYAAGTWEPGPRLGPGRPWDATTELAVLGQLNGTYRLVELATGRELARLEDPEQNEGKAAFTPDGTKLVISAKNGLRVWNLRRLRAALAELGLDWDAPLFPPAAEGKGAPPLRVAVDLGELGPK